MKLWLWTGLLWGLVISIQPVQSQSLDQNKSLPSKTTENKAVSKDFNYWIFEANSKDDIHLYDSHRLLWIFSNIEDKNPATTHNQRHFRIVVHFPKSEASSPSTKNATLLMDTFAINLHNQNNSLTYSADISARNVHAFIRAFTQAIMIRIIKSPVIMEIPLQNSDLAIKAMNDYIQETHAPLPEGITSEDLTP